MRNARFDKGGAVRGRSKPLVKEYGFRKNGNTRAHLDVIILMN